MFAGGSVGVYETVVVRRGGVWAAGANGVYSFHPHNT